MSETPATDIFANNSTSDETASDDNGTEDPLGRTIKAKHPSQEEMFVHAIPRVNQHSPKLKGTNSLPVLYRSRFQD
jgi:hypothetical protein